MKAEEILESMCYKNNTQPVYRGKTTKDIVLQSMREYAKQKCKEQRKICNENIGYSEDGSCHECGGYCVEENSILNAPEPEFD